MYHVCVINCIYLPIITMDDKYAFLLMNFISSTSYLSDYVYRLAIYIPKELNVIQITQIH